MTDHRRSHHGRSLSVPRGLAVRPTSARVLEAIFNILGQRCDGDVVCDLYAGSGALAIEAAIRGASRIVLVEQDRGAVRAIRANVARRATGCVSEVLQADVVEGLERLARRGERFDLVLADPPYDRGEVDRVLAAVQRCSVLAEDGVMVIEHSPRERGQERYEDLSRVDERKYGQTSVSFFEQGAS